MSSGRNVAATPSACGNIAASRAISPEQISSCTIAGMPSRVCSMRWRWIEFARSAASAARKLLAPLIRVMWPMPSASSGAACCTSKPVLVGDLEHPHAAELAELLVDRHPREQVGRAVGDRQRRVAVRQGSAFGLVIFIRFIRSLVHSRTAPAVRPPMIWRSAMA